jgi:hypothetical protein
MDSLTKNDLQQLLINTKKQIQIIDNKSIYSISYYYNNDGEKREELVALIEAIEINIMYRDDDEKRANYKLMRDRDPLKNKIFKK